MSPSVDMVSRISSGTWHTSSFFLIERSLPPFFRCLFRGDRELIGIAGRLHLIPGRAFGRCRHGAPGPRRTRLPDTRSAAAADHAFSSRSLLSELSKRGFPDQKMRRSKIARILVIYSVCNRSPNPKYTGNRPESVHIAPFVPIWRRKYASPL